MTPHQKHLQDAAKRRAKVRELAATTRMTHDEIAKKVKLTRQRVSQILAEKAK